MQNHLMIGLGGTGGKILRSLRKNIFQEFRSNDQKIINIQYLYVDSSKEMMALDDVSWRILGESVQLAECNQLLIKGGNLKQVIDNLAGYPNIKPWIGSSDQWKLILNTIVGETLGGQKRRLGRFLFACQGHSFKNQLKQRASDLTTNGNASITFHICCGLAGGTGSGCVIDVIAQIRALYPDPLAYRIVVYALLPEEIPNPNWDTGNYHANGYAALAELNALSTGSYQPLDVVDKGNRLQLKDPFNGCYIFSNQNENGLQIDVDKTLPNIVADFLFQKLIATSNADTLRLIERMENAENVDATPEICSYNKTLRSKRFLTFGIKRLAVPETEIREYIAYIFARQAALQLRYNNWDDTSGFRDDPRNQEFGEFVRDKQTLERWFLTDEHVSLSRGILPEEVKNKNWKPILNEWLDIVPQFIGLVQALDDKVWLNDLEKLLAQRYEENYRNVGVRKFYEIKKEALKVYIKELRRRIEEELFNEWKNGVKSMHDLSRCVMALITFLEERGRDADERISRVKANVDNAEHKVEANRNEWAKVGLLSHMLGKRRKLLDIHGELLRELYTSRTQVEAWTFAKRLLQESVTEFNTLATDISLCSTLVDESIKEFKNRIDERCNDNDKPDLRQSLVRFYNADNVRSFSRDLEKDPAIQKNQSQIVRETLIGQIAAEPSFAAFHNRITRQLFFNVLEQECTLSSQRAHDALVASDHNRQSLLGVNIIGQLDREYSGKPDELRKFTYDLVKSAGNFLEFDPQAIVIGNSNVKISQFIIIMPKAGEHYEFANRLKTMFQNHLRGGIPVAIIESDTKPNEITLLGITYLFPLRYAKSVKFLKEKYDERIKSANNPDQIRLELHSEGDGRQFSELLPPPDNELREKLIPSLFLAKALNLITAIVNPTTGSRDLYLIDEDEFGLPVHTRLGKNLPEIAENIELHVAQILQKTSDDTLQQDGWKHIDKIHELKQKIRAELKDILTERKEDFEDAVYRRFEAAAREAIKSLPSY
jgi:hypothetical protein